MTPVIQAGAIFHNATPAMLYELFMDSAKHSAATGMPAKISAKVGGKWSAFGGMIHGKTLALVPNKMTVQTWRSSGGKRPIQIPSSSSSLKNPQVVAQPYT
jgi:activator of HSP90 ATPase